MNDDTINDAMTMRSGTPLALGRIDQYELVRELGGGGFGTVYLAKDTVAGIEVAVKGLPPLVKNSIEELENIRANFALVSRLTHTNIAKMLVLHPAQSVVYASEDVHGKLRVNPGDMLMVMEYALGVTLSNWRKQFPDRKVPLANALRIVRQIALALDYAHERKIVHRDIKPANVMIETMDEGMATARILDFGLAAEIRSSMGRISREIRDTSGTRPYMAPEQWLGGKQGPATDQYALAVLFYELILGEVPFAAVFDTGDPVVMMNVVGRETFVAPSDLSKAVRNALEKALAKKPEERFTSCCEFVDALEGKVKTSGKGTDSQGKIGLGLILCVVAAVGMIVAGGWWLMRPSPSSAPVLDAVPEPAPAVVKPEPAPVVVKPEPAPMEPEKKMASERKGEPRHGEVRVLILPGGAKMEMIYCAPGSFKMGDDDGEDDEKPAHVVNLTKGFWLGKCEVTQAQWKSVMGGHNPSGHEGDELPVENVSWDDCRDFIKNMNLKAKYCARLPTEAEWEYACRAGTTGHFAAQGLEKFTLKHPESVNALGRMGWYDGNSGGETHPVGRKQANAWGFHDMHGNVWEWCNDCYDGTYYGVSPRRNPKGPSEEGGERVSRGGSYNDLPERCRSAYREKGGTGDCGMTDGFRLCCSVESDELK